MSQGFYGFPRILDIVRATTFKALGKAGATNGAALAGGTASGAPVAPAGPFDVGDMVPDATGKLWICTTAGTSQSSPGSFTQVAGATSPLTTKGDVWVYGAADNRLGVGSDNQVLTADSTQSLGLKWAVTAAGAGGALTQLAQTTLGATTADITYSGLSASYTTLWLIGLFRTTSGNNADDVRLQINSDTGSHYFTSSAGPAQTFCLLGTAAGGATGAGRFGSVQAFLSGYAVSSTWFVIPSLLGRSDATSDAPSQLNSLWNPSSASVVSTLRLFPGAGSWAAGTQVTLYGLS